MSDSNDDSIPVLHEILVPGNPAQAHRVAAGDHAPAAQPVHPVAPVLQPERPEPGFGQQAPLASDGPREPAFTQEPALSAEPALAPEPTFRPQRVVALDGALAPGVAHAPDASRAHETHAHDGHEHEPHARARRPHKPARAPEHGPAATARPHEDGLATPSAEVFDGAEPLPPLEAGSIVPPDLQSGGSAHSGVAQDVNAEAIARNLRGRVAGFLTGDGRGIIETRCREALEAHTTQLVGQITREVALALENELAGWVRQAVEEELTRRSRAGGVTSA